MGEKRKALATLFMETEGDAVIVDGDSVVAIDILALYKGTVTIEFVSKPAPRPMGVALKVPNGHILLPDGEKVARLYTWNLPDLPNRVSYHVATKDGVLKLWNIYTINGFIPTQAEYWTNNAGMVVEVVDQHTRRYHCSSGDGEFDKSNLVFTVQTIEEGSGQV